MSDYISTAGAVPVLNEKGVLVMEKVKVKRYVPGKRPDYAPRSDDSEEEEEDDVAVIQNDDNLPVEETEIKDTSDPRLKRLMQTRRASQINGEGEGRRRVHEGEVVVRRHRHEEEEEEATTYRDVGSDQSSDDEEEVSRRRELLRLKALARRKAEEEAEAQERERGKGEEEVEESGEEGSEYEEVTDSEEEEEEESEDEALLKPVFVRKTDRATIKEREAREADEAALEEERAVSLEERKKQSHDMVAEAVKADYVQADDEPESADDDELSDGDGNEQEEFESWKIRELARVKREREEKEARENEIRENEKRRNMTDDQLQAEGKEFTNAAPKGRYKFLQKYYHRGAFFVSAEEDKVYQRDYSEATGMDSFDKTVLPKVMQVKNFGRAGRTKWTHLTGEDTTNNESLWAENSIQRKALGGSKQDLSRPSSRKKAL